MKILLVADTELNNLWGKWSPYMEDQMAGIDLILSAGDLSPYYLEFLVTMVNVPLLYVPGNHDELYEKRPPEGCINIDETVVDIGGIRIGGLAGSRKYRNGIYMYTEREMRGKIRRLWRSLRRAGLRDRLRREGAAQSVRTDGGRGRIDILLTHAPCRGHGDMEDLPHQGFECFNKLLEDLHPVYHCYGHVHQEYGHFRRKREHPSGTRLINGSGMYIFEI